jgi:hypothetical protein
MTRAPALEAPGPRAVGRNTICRQVRRFVVSAPSAVGGFRCEDRISVTGSHPWFDGTCGVHPQNRNVIWWRAIQRCSFLPFLCYFFLCCGPPVPEPHANFMAPPTCGGLSCQASPGPTSARLRALTWNYVRVLPFLANVPCLAARGGEALPPLGRASRGRSSGPCVTLGLHRLRFRRSSLSTRETLTAVRQDV